MVCCAGVGIRGTWAQYPSHPLLSLPLPLPVQTVHMFVDALLTVAGTL